MQTRSGAQSGTRLAEANRQIDSGAPLAQVMKSFDNRVDAAKHYAGRLAQIYSPQNADPNCWQCQIDAHGQLVCCDWRGFFTNTEVAKDAAAATAKFIALSLVIQLFAPFVVIYLPRGKMTEKVTFSTCHGLCPSCFKAIRTRRALGITLEVVAKFLFVFGLIAVPCASLAYFWLAPRSERGPVLPFLLLSIGILLGGTLLVLPVRGLRTPRGLRSVAGPPFELTGMKRSL
jgi:hypothetical protein